MKPATWKWVRRASVAVACTLVVVVTSTTLVFAMHDFPDVSTANPFHDDIGWMSEEGISTGYDDGTFRPGEPVTRQAMAAFMHRLFDRLQPERFDRPIHVFVVCAASTRHAVVGATGTFVRGSAGTTSSRLATGTYQITFDIDVTACSWQATVGVTGSSGTATGWANVAGRSGVPAAIYVSTYDTPASP